MPELRFFNRPKPQPSAYYNGSTIDFWLNGEFLDSLGGITPVPSTINIMVKEAFGCTGRETEDIVRDAFFLSYGEAGSRDTLVIRANGDKLAYFWLPIKRCACIEGGTFTGWFLRSSSTWNTDAPAVVGRDGSTGNGNVSYKQGVRPAFCLDSATEVVLEELPDIGRVFVIRGRREPSEAEPILASNASSHLLESLIKYTT